MTSIDFDVESLARHLQVPVDQIARMAERGKLPGRRIGGQWRFAAADIHHWWEERIGSSDETELAEVESVLSRQPVDSDERPLPMRELIFPELVAAPLPARTRSSVITEMVQLGVDAGMIWDADRMEEAVRTRENLHPTALDNGVALLHPRRPLPSIIAQPFLALGRTPQGVPFGHPRGVLTDVFFLIGSTDDRTHLRVLARLSRLVADNALVRSWRLGDSAEEIWQSLVDRDVELSA